MALPEVSGGNSGRSELLEQGATVIAYDPMPTARERSADLVPGLEVVNAAADAIRDADIAILVTEWPEFVDFDWAIAAPTMRRRVLIDGRNVLNGEELAAFGFTYTSFGRGTVVPDDVKADTVAATGSLASLQWGRG